LSLQESLEPVGTQATCTKARNHAGFRAIKGRPQLRLLQSIDHKKWPDEGPVASLIWPVAPRGAVREVGPLASRRDDSLEPKVPVERLQIEIRGIPLVVAHPACALLLEQP
jgi:hypothetical protein